MKLQIIVLFTIICLIICSSCSEKKNDFQTVENKFNSINTEYRISIINSCFWTLRNTDDSLFYAMRHTKFTELTSYKGNELSYLEKYITAIKNDFVDKEFSREFFDDQIQILEIEVKTVDFLTLYTHIIEFEELFNYGLKKNKAFSFDGINSLTSCIAPFKSVIRLGDTLRAGTGVFAAHVGYRPWINTADIYYVESDTILLKSFIDTLGNSRPNFQTIEFTPTKKGNYLIKGNNLIFSNNTYQVLEFESEFSVK